MNWVEVFSCVWIIFIRFWNRIWKFWFWIDKILLQCYLLKEKQIERWRELSNNRRLSKVIIVESTWTFQLTWVHWLWSCLRNLSICSWKIMNKSKDKLLENIPATNIVAVDIFVIDGFLHLRSFLEIFNQWILVTRLFFF